MRTRFSLNNQKKSDEETKPELKKEEKADKDSKNKEKKQKDKIKKVSSDQLYRATIIIIASFVRQFHCFYFAIK